MRAKLSFRYAYAMLVASEVSAASVVIRYGSRWVRDIVADLTQLLAESCSSRSLDHHHPRYYRHPQRIHCELVW